MILLGENATVRHSLKFRSSRYRVRDWSKARSPEAALIRLRREGAGGAHHHLPFPLLLRAAPTLSRAEQYAGATAA